MLEIFMRTVASRNSELRREVHAGETGDVCEVGKTDVAVEMRFDVLFDTTQTPLGQAIDLDLWAFEPSHMHGEGPAYAACKLPVGRVPIPGQHLCKLIDERITQQYQFIHAFGRE